MIGRLATTIGLGALAVVTTAGHVQAQQRGEECRVEEMDPRRGPAQQTFCRGPDGQWRPRPDLDAATASGRPTASRPAPGVPAASVLPDDWRGTITYSGTHEGHVQQAGPGMRDLSVGSVVGAVAGGQRQRYAGRYDLVLTIDGASVTGQASGTGGLEPATFSGTRTGALCRMFMEGAEIEATCTSEQFVGASRSPRGASPSFLMNIDLRATKVVDAAEEERLRAEAAERARAERAEAEAAERARIAAMPLATSAQTRMVEAAVRQDSGAWWANRYDADSVTNVRVAERNGSTATLRAEYTFNGGSPGWVLAQVRGMSVECLDYWDMAGCAPVRSPAPPAPARSVRSASAGGEPIADKGGSTACLRRSDGGEGRATVTTDDTIVYMGEDNYSSHDVLGSRRFTYANVCERSIEYELAVGRSDYKQTFSLAAKSEHHWYCSYVSGENLLGMLITVRDYCEQE